MNTYAANAHRNTFEKPRHFTAILFGCLLYLFIVNTVLAADSRVVLVCSNNSSLSSLNMTDIRRIYLGLNPINIKTRVNPVLNLSNRYIYEDFLKNIMHMTEDSYKRKMIKRVFRRGASQIPEVKSIKELVTHLKNNPNDISFLSEKTAEETNGIRVIQRLW